MLQLLIGLFNDMALFFQTEYLQCSQKNPKNTGCGGMSNKALIYYCCLSLGLYGFNKCHNQQLLPNCYSWCNISIFLKFKLCYEIQTRLAGQNPQVT